MSNLYRAMSKEIILVSMYNVREYIQPALPAALGQEMVAFILALIDGQVIS